MRLWRRGASRLDHQESAFAASVEHFFDNIDPFATYRRDLGLVGWRACHRPARINVYFAAPGSR